MAPPHEGWELEPGQEWQQMNTWRHEGETGGHHNHAQREVTSHRTGSRQQDLLEQV